MSFRFFCILFLLSIEAFASGSSCQKTFKSQSIYETEKFLDKKYSLNYLKNVVDKTFSAKQIMHAYPVLEREEMMEIAKHYQDQKDERSYYILFFSNLKLAYSFALNYSKYDRENFEDYLQEALLALSTAIKSYDSSKGFVLSTYAGRSILNGFGRFQDYNPKLGIKIHRDRELVKKLGEELLKNPEEYGTAAWLEQFQKTYRSYGSLFSKERIQTAMLNFSSQENRLYGEASLRIGDVRSSANADEAPSGYDTLRASTNLEKNSVDRVFLQEILEWLYKKLDQEKEKEFLFVILKERILVEEEDRISLKELGKRFGRSPENAAQKETKIKNMIRRKFGAQKEISFKELMRRRDLLNIRERQTESRIRGGLIAEAAKKKKIEFEEILKRVPSKDILEWLDKELDHKQRKDLFFAIIKERILVEKKDRALQQELGKRFNCSKGYICHKETQIRDMIRDKFGSKDGERSREI